jgi:NAD(P)-dependent dehydrogenase (short-subunit alcohol dehydrogenase family)
MDFLNTPEKLDRRMTHVPMGRFGEAVEQAKAVVFRESLPSRPLQAYELMSAVASDDSSFINGTDFMVDGGLHACYVVSSYRRQISGHES